MYCDIHPLPQRVHAYLDPMNAISKHDSRHVMGEYCEDLAAGIYRMAKFQLLARHQRVQGVEIDLIATRSGTFHFVEVKYRKTILAASRCLTTKQLGRIATAAHSFAQEHSINHIQVDVMLFDAKLNWQRIDNIDTTSQII